MVRILILLLFLPHIAYADSLLTVSFLDVGQGDGIYIEAPNGRQMLIDGGPGTAILEPLQKAMPFGDRSLDVLMITNPDADHISGFLDILDQYLIGSVVEPGTRATSKTYAALKKKIFEQKIPYLLARKGMTITLDTKSKVYFTVLFPDRNVTNWSRNDGSIHGILTYGKTKIYFTGDGTQKTEKIVVEQNPKGSLRSDILKTGHHGSKTSTSDLFVSAVAPFFAVISDGKGNMYGHPHSETLDTLENNDVEVLRTDQIGTITFMSNGKSLVQVK